MKKVSRKKLLVAGGVLVLVGFVCVLVLPLVNKWVVLRRVKAVGYETIVRDAQAILSHHPAPVGVQAVLELRRDGYGDGIRNIRPKDVRVGDKGLYLIFRSFFVEEDGIFIPRKAAGFQPSNGDPSYEPIVDGVYWYEIKG